MVSVNTLCKNILNVKNTVVEDCCFYSDPDGVKHIRIKARPNKWHGNDCPFCHKPCPVYDRHSRCPRTWRGLDAGGILKEIMCMKKMCEEAEKIMTERFGKDMVIALATVEKGVPYVRYVNAYYENGAFYVITYALSNKIKHLENNPVIAIAGEWFTAHGKGINLGYF